MCLRASEGNNKWTMMEGDLPILAWVFVVRARLNG